MYSRKNGEKKYVEINNRSTYWT